MILTHKLAPRWIIFFIDLILVMLAFVFAFSLRQIITQEPFNLAFVDKLIASSLTNLMISIVGMVVFQSYSGIIRYTEIKDIKKVILFASFQLVFWFIVLATDHGDTLSPLVSKPTVILNCITVIFIMVIFRLAVKELFHRALTFHKNSSKLIIYGADNLGLTAKKVLEEDKNINNKVIAFIDDDPRKIDKTLGDIPIYDAGSPNLKYLFKNKGISELIIATHKLSFEQKSNLSDICSALKIKINIVPPPEQWKNDLFHKVQMRELSIEDLLDRDEIILPEDANTDIYKQACVMVTGAAGSIGSEICRQLVKLDIRELVLLDQSESGLYDLRYELSNVKTNAELIVEIASIRDKERLEEVFLTHKPNFIFHAAAYKHVPLMEEFCDEAVLTNVKGTQQLADMAVKYEVKKFVMVSTDKAVNPTNVMGATKRIAEIYVQHLSDVQKTTQFITTRFGNVLGSAGSVVPLFKKQIQQGGPITITHPDITRYFMTIPEASKLVLEAGRIGNSGDILVFDMGKPVKILDMATKMIQLAGFQPNVDIKITFSGLRPGEKMYEELFKDAENLLPTHHPRILKARKTNPIVPDFFDRMESLKTAGAHHQPQAVKSIIPLMLPEYTPFEQTLVL
ncbi:MAG: polysaccharide biosynthesis protein [Ferruginibacter sp.]